MSYDNTGKNWGISQLVTMTKNGTFKFDNIVQRSYVWERKRKSLFIHSIILGIPILEIYAKRSPENPDDKNTKKIYDVLDGKQRLLTLKSFFNNEFKLAELKPIEFYNELSDTIEIVDISNKTFEELSEGLQEKLRSSRITVTYFDNITKEEEKELFKRLNNGRPVTGKSKSLASCIDLENLLDIGSHELFNDMLSEKALENKNQAIIVMKAYCMMFLNNDEFSFESRVFNPLMEKTEISEEERIKMIPVFDMIKNIHEILIGRNEKKVARKLYKETHMISLIPFFVRAIDNGIEEENIADWVLEFFKPENGNTSISEEYNNACGSGSAKSISIQIRNSALENSYAEFFEIG